MLTVIYSQQYLNYNFGVDHPFWPERALQFIKLLKKGDLKFKIIEPKRASDKDILLVHSKEYLKRVKRLAEEHGALSIDTPVNPEVLEGISDSSGFCIFNDHSIAIKKLQKERKIKKAMIYDLDVHAGQGTQEIFYSDPTVFTVSIHQDPQTLYPGTGFAWQTGEGEGKGHNLNVPLLPGTREFKYLCALDNILPLAKKFKPDVVVLVLGVDTYKEDPLASINLEANTYGKIGERFKRFEKLAVMCAGGYCQKTPELWLSFLKGYL